MDKTQRKRKKEPYVRRKFYMIFPHILDYLFKDIRVRNSLGS